MMELIKDYGGRVVIKVTCKDPFTSKWFSHELLVTKSQYIKLQEKDKYHIQDILVSHTADERELFITGMYPGSLGENFFYYTCTNCAAFNDHPIALIGRPTSCKNCGTTSEPFKIMEG